MARSVIDNLQAAETTSQTAARKIAEAKGTSDPKKYKALLNDARGFNDDSQDFNSEAKSQIDPARQPSEHKQPTAQPIGNSLQDSIESQIEEQRQRKGGYLRDR